MTLLKRRLFDQLAAHLPEKEFTVVVGARQTGKTTLLNQLMQALRESNDEVYLLTLEDHAILRQLNEHPENLFNLVIRNPDSRLYILIDEVQYLDDPSNFLKLIYDKYAPQVKVIATGSSAFYIDKKFKDSLAGRKRLFELYTLDFDEFLYFKTGTHDLATELERIRKNQEYISARRIEMETFLLEYLTFGGYPAVVLASSGPMKVEILKELTGSFIKRDIAEANIQDTAKFYQLMTLLSQQTGALVNTNELSRTLRLSVTAVDNYLYVLQKCFHIQLIRPFFSNLRKEITKMPKVYFHDLGFRNALLNQYQPLAQRIDKGMLLENYAFIRLRNMFDNDTIKFWRTADGNEVDFVIIQIPGSGIAIEIKSDEVQFNPSRYKKFIEEYPNYILQVRALQATNNRSSLLAL